MQNREVAVNEFISKMPQIKIAPYIFQNKGDGTFIKRTEEWGMNRLGIASGSAYADLDNDGDLDLLISNTNDFASVYKNNSEKILQNNYLKIKLKGDPKNDWGIGAKVTVHCNDSLYFQEQQPVRGFQSSVDPVLNFGVGKNGKIDSVVVIWPDDKMQVISSVNANQTLEVKIADANRVWKYDSTVVEDKLFSVDSTFGFTHRENIYNDFNTQLLMPNYLSRQGPCMVKSDVNKDGREDLFIGGAKGQAGQLFIQGANGKFLNKPQPSVMKDSMSEDVAAEFFDADGDGDQDLYVGSGGYEFAENDLALKGRLYFNDGSGNFSKRENSIPGIFISTSCVKASDVDGDGDQDLFIGGRLVPGKYPLSPESKILLNDGKGNFSDATANVAPALQNVGMVTDALWIDLNKDNAHDLIVVGEWMPVKVFINQKGKLSDSSSSYIKFASKGWWNRIFTGDFDNDGDEDLVIGNLGMNAQFRASEKEPVSVYYKDFDGNGSVDPIFCYYIDGVSYPALSRDDLMDQLPMLKKKFLKYSTYATATINDLFEKEQLEGAEQLTAEILTTVYLQNDGLNGFSLRQLPAEAQYAPVYAMAALDANRDGKKDLVLAGNNAWTRIRFSRYDANHGILLTGDGKGNFNYEPQWKSGFNIRGDVRSLQTINTEKRTDLVFGVNDSRVKVYHLRK